MPGQCTTRLLVGPFGSGKTTEIQRRAAELGVGMTLSLPQAQTAMDTHLCIDDVDTWTDADRSAVLKLAKARAIQVLATARVPVNGFEMIEKRSQSFLPKAHQRLVSLVFGVYNRVCIDPDESLLLVPTQLPVTDRYARAAALQLVRRIDNETVCIGGCPEPFRQALLEMCPNLTFWNTTDKLYGHRAKRIVALLFNPVQAEDLLELLTRADEQLTVVFDSQNPPEALARVRTKLFNHIPKSAPWINWEGYAVCKSQERKRKRRGVDSVDPKTVTALVAYLGKLCRERGVRSANMALQIASEELGWATVPRYETLVPSADAIVQQSDPSLGLAAELLMLRELSFVEPCTPNIILPEAVQRFRRAVFVDNPVFLRAWAAQPGLHKISQSPSAWAELMSDKQKWGNPSSQLLADIAKSPTPIIVLPASLRQFQAQGDRAASAYIDPRCIGVPDWVVLTLAAIIRIVDQGHHAVPFPALDAEACDLRRLSERARHFWCRTGTRYVQEQVPIRTDDGFRGFCDFALNDDAVLELKCSVAEDTSFTASVLWPLQVAVYAHTLRRPNGFVFNVNRNQISCVRFNPNHLV